MVSYKGMALVVFILWSQFAYVHSSSSSDDCTVVSQVLESCYIDQQSETFFMKAESLCCKSLDVLEKRIRDLQLSRYTVCECFRASHSEKELLVNENLLEVQVLCGPHIPYPITSYSDCVQYVDEGMNAIAALM